MIDIEQNTKCLLFNNYFVNMISPTLTIPPEYKIFYTKNYPNIPIKHFINYLMSSNIIDPENITISQIYCIALLQKLFQKGFTINMNNCHRVILIMLMLTSKIIEDECYSNKTWALAAGLTPEEINFMENIILKVLDYDVFISTHQLSHINKSFYL